MKIDDRVILAKTKLNQDSIFWKRKEIDYNSVGTVMSISPKVAKYIFVSVQWDNSSTTICAERYLKFYKDVDIPLPNRMFKREVI